MSELIKHECGVTLIRLLKPLSFYQEKYGMSLYGINKLRIIMQKMRNRGQDGAGVATIKLNTEPGNRYISRKRTKSADNLKDLFESIYERFIGLSPTQLKNVEFLKKNYPYTGEVLLGHLRYGTHGSNTIETVHPFLRQSNWKSRNLLLAGNFNLTNVDELFHELVELGQFPKEKSDTVTVLEKIGHFLDDEIERILNWYKEEGLSHNDLNDRVFHDLDITRILKRAFRKFDGGYVLAGIVGHGDAFVLRDPSGIRPCYYYHDDEVMVAASERPAIQTAFNVHISNIKELKPGHVLVTKVDGRISELPYMEPLTIKPCSFERIYFSRGTDRDIYLERKKLGGNLCEAVLKKVKHDYKNTVFSFIPNTAETAFLGFIKGLEQRMNKLKFEKIMELNGGLKEKKLAKILAMSPRVEKLVVKDAKLRTFITDDSSRDEMVSHVYDVTYGIVDNNKDTLVLIDDSIVRGTTLKKSIIGIVSRLRPKRIIIVSSAPQIRYPDCYGIDMSKMKDFIAFRALISLIEEDNKTHLLQEVYKRCLASLKKSTHKVKNEVKPLYANYSTDKISDRIAKLVTPVECKVKIDVIYQTLEGLHDACPNHKGDWYFSGDYPTPGGNLVANKAFIQYMENNNQRAY